MTPQPPHLNVAEEVRAILARRGIRPYQLAEELGMTPESLGRRLRGRVPFTVDEVFDLATVLDTPISVLYGQWPWSSWPEDREPSA